MGQIAILGFPGGNNVTKGTTPLTFGHNEDISAALSNARNKINLSSSGDLALIRVANGSRSHNLRVIILYATLRVLYLCVFGHQRVQ